MEQIELEKFVQKAIADIETGVETEKRGGETDKIGDPLPGEKIRWKAPTETGHAKTAKAYIPIDKRASLKRVIIGIIIITITIDTIVYLPKPDYPPSERAPSEQVDTGESPYPVKEGKMFGKSFGIQTSSSSSNLNEADFERIKRKIDEFLNSRGDKNGLFLLC